MFRPTPPLCVWNTTTTAIGGQLGADVDLSGLGEFDAATTLFSESNSRFVVSVAPEKAAELDALVKPFKETLQGV